ncbi:MAG TPA: glycosyltransferase [Bacteroidota bacterium]|nr:glycosyltransferase [Bacteroidota bacterium]
MHSAAIIPAILIVCALYYSAVQTSLLLGLRNLPPGKMKNRPSVSVIVAARNEERTIGRLLDALSGQTFRPHEIIIADDRSDDRTARIVSDHQKQDGRIHVCTITDVPEGISPKKNALKTAIDSSSGEILCFTDADCLPGPRWVESLVAMFDETTGLVAGYSPYDRQLQPKWSLWTGLRTIWKELFLGFVEYEELKGAVWSAGSIGLRHGWLCTGRNLAYRRAVYDEVGGFESIKRSLSGDDDLFLQQVRRRTKWGIAYCVSPDSFVRTAPPPTFGSFVRQRRRHFSAGKYFTPGMKLFFLLFHGANLALLAGFVLFLIHPPTHLVAFAAFLSKVLIDTLLFLASSDLFGRISVGSSFFLMEILYILYNTLIGPLGFVGTIKWNRDAAR